jgi:hypothetical protein
MMYDEDWDEGYQGFHIEDEPNPVQEVIRELRQLFSRQKEALATVDKEDTKRYWYKRGYIDGLDYSISCLEELL